LEEAFQKFASDVTYAATDAYYVDQMGDSFELQMTNTVYKRGNDAENTHVELPAALKPKITVKTYDVYKASEVNGTTVTEAMVGQRKGTGSTVEEITFEDDGNGNVTKVKSSLLGDANILDSNGIICAKNFYYIWHRNHPSPREHATSPPWR
ncbi:MAG: hypothetical protein II323_00005, partial [Tidjanibacter sp.]|nr:hypothetical protein [Tidjanibacter sp.]